MWKAWCEEPIKLALWIRSREQEREMPTYVCYVPNGKLSDPQKQEIATAICNRHSEATGAPPFFVQVVVEEQGTSKRFLGGTATDNHIWIRGDIRAGRAEERRGQIMRGIMNDVSRITGNPIDDIWVYLCNLAPTDMVEYGHVLPKLGEEQQWFASLPLSLRKYLESLGVHQESFQL
jgi:phenylpyruvate tautomerase PptA (4-oxalocrotonate tautomerase family)